MPRPVPAVLTIAGSDSGGAAGIQADLKAFAAAGVHGMTAVTALTAQSTVEVSGILPVPPEFVLEQVRTVAADIGVDAVKLGMLGGADVVRAVREAIDLLPAGTPLVVDPVMLAESGARLLAEEAVTAMLELLFPRATVVTPNIPEALALCGALGHELDAASPDVAEQAARILHAAGPDVAIVTGGHRDVIVDTVFDGREVHRIEGERQPDGAAHGSGCTHASTLAAHLAHGFTPLAAARAAHAAAARAVRDGLRDLGDGAGPVDVLGVGARARQIRASAEAAARDLS